MAELLASPKKARADGQLSALAGELFVAAELLKRGYQTSITFGNAKAIGRVQRSGTHLGRGSREPEGSRSAHCPG